MPLTSPVLTTLKWTRYQEELEPFRTEPLILETNLVRGGNLQRPYRCTSALVERNATVFVTCAIGSLTIASSDLLLREQFFQDIQEKKPKKAVIASCDPLARALSSYLIT